jgi:AcrR family transcriptional regulator
MVATDMTERAVIDGRTARKDRNMVAVLDAVLELFIKGDLIPSPEAVAQRSRVSLRSVYRYLAASSDLVHAAIERHLERVGPLFALDHVGEGPFATRVENFVAARLRLYQAIAPMARAAQARTRMRATPASEIIRESLNARRGLLRVQLSRHFATELATFGPGADAILAAADALTQIETIDWYLVDGGYTLAQTREALVTGLGRLLTPAVKTEACAS